MKRIICWCILCLFFLSFCTACDLDSAPTHVDCTSVSVHQIYSGMKSSEFRNLFSEEEAYMLVPLFFSAELMATCFYDKNGNSVVVLWGEVGISQIYNLGNIPIPEYKDFETLKEGMSFVEVFRVVGIPTGIGSSDYLMYRYVLNNGRDVEISFDANGCFTGLFEALSSVSE